jgi:hypothetical protein
MIEMRRPDDYEILVWFRCEVCRKRHLLEIPKSWNLSDSIFICARCTKRRWRADSVEWRRLFLALELAGVNHG